MMSNRTSPYKVAVVGAGLYGLTFARIMHEAGHKVIVFEQSESLGGLAADYLSNNVYVGVTEPTFLTRPEPLAYNFLKQFGKFRKLNNYIPVFMTNKDKLYPLNDIFLLASLLGYEGLATSLPDEALETMHTAVTRPLMDVLYKYTGDPTMWEFHFDASDMYLPINGWSNLCTNMSSPFEVVTDHEFTLADIDVAKYIMYTGPIDKLLGVEIGIQYVGYHAQHQPIEFENAQHFPVVYRPHVKANEDVPVFTSTNYNLLYKVRGLEEYSELYFGRILPIHLSAYVFRVVESADNQALIRSAAKQLPQNFLLGGHLGECNDNDAARTVLSAITRARSFLSEGVFSS